MITHAGTGLLVWVTAISKYFDVAKNVGPRVAYIHAVAAHRPTRLEE